MDISKASERCNSVMNAVSRAVITDEETLETVLTGVLARGHVLLEDVPGTGKTLAAQSFATALGLSFTRVQFTPDLLPTDITGTDTYNEARGEFQFTKGPLFANVVLADEINRASPKTQAALLEAMEERQVTVNGTTHSLPDPFFVIATQNPVDEGQGTFPLPQAQKDRFLVKTSLGYPDRSGELEILTRRAARDSRHPSASRQLSPEGVRELTGAVETVHVSRDIMQYITELVEETRVDPRTELGVSPRGTQRLFEVARARAVLENRDYVVPDDIKRVAHSVLDHRLVLTTDARIEDRTQSQVVEDILEDLPVPTVNRAAPQ